MRSAAIAAVAGLLAAGCGSAPAVIPPSEQPLSTGTLMLLGKKGMTPASPIYVRIFKEESELEVWKARDDGHFYHFKTYPICNWSGELGPKQKYGDKQAPEGFYTVTAAQMKPNSEHYLAFNLGYPNAFDRAQARDGDALMVHGQCKSAGCYAMTDALIEEIYGLAREAIRGGQPSFEVHAFPFRLTKANLDRHKANPWYPFWLTLKQGYEHFDKHRIPPAVAVCERRYIVNVVLPEKALEPDSSCPKLRKPKLAPFVPKQSEQQVAEERIVMPGPKMRAVASAAPVASAPLASAAPVPPAPVAVTNPQTRYGLGVSPKGAAGTALGYAE